MDESKMDSRFTVEHRKAEIAESKDWYGMPPMCAMFMTWLVTDFRGTTPNGFSFRTKGRRLSGEAATTVENTKEEAKMSFADYSLCLIRANRTDILTQQILHMLSRGRVGERFFAIGVAGDDNHSKSRPFLRPYLNDHPIKRALGFECVSVWTDQPEFLSSTYVPVAPYTFSVRYPPVSLGTAEMPWVEHPFESTGDLLELKCSTLLCPLIGRQLAKCGWDIEMDPDPLGKMSSVMRGVSRYWNCVPVLRAVVSKYAPLSSRPALVDSYKICNMMEHQDVPATWLAYCRRYEVSIDQLIELERIIADSPLVFDLSTTIAIRLAAIDLYAID
jgi:hypothetical protein